MQNNHDQSRGYQFNGSVEAKSIGDNHYYGNNQKSSELNEVKLNIIENSLQIISKEKLEREATIGKRLRDTFISLLCIEILIFFGIIIFFSAAKNIIELLVFATFPGIIFIWPHLKFIRWYSNRPELAGGNSYIGNCKFMKDEDDCYWIYEATAKCIYDKGNCPGIIKIVEAPPEEAKLGMRIVGKCLSGHGHSYAIDINNLIAMIKPIDWSDESEK